MEKNEFQKLAESKVKRAIELIAEAREDLTLWQLKEYVRGNYVILGGEGFLVSIGDAISNSPMVDFYEKIEETLEECDEYFDNKSDADCDEGVFIPNKEMELLVRIRNHIYQLSYGRNAKRF